MKKILAGLLAIVLIAIGGFFGLQLYLRHRITSDIEASFEQVRQAGGKASHGKVSFDLWTRTLTIADFAGETASQPPLDVKVGLITVVGANQPDPTRWTASRLDLADIEGGAQMPALNGARVAFKVPQLTANDVAVNDVPANPSAGTVPTQATAESSSPLDAYRRAIRRLTGVTAASVSIPSATGTANFGTAAPGALDFAYTNYTLTDIRDGKIAATKADSLSFALDMQSAGQPQKMTGHLANLAASEIDMTAALAMLDPETAGDDRTYRLYHSVSAGPYEITSSQGISQGIKTRIAAMATEDVSVQPSRMHLPELLAMLPQLGAVPTPAQTREISQHMAALYEGLSIAHSEMRGLSLGTPQGPMTLAAIHLSLDHGKGEFAIEDLAGNSPKGPVQVGRIAIKSFDMARLLRMAGQFSDPATPKTPDQALGFLAVLGGVEVGGVAAPFKDTRKVVKIDTFNLTWGQFVGPIPTQARLVAKMTVPVDPADQAQKPPVAAGIDTIALDLDLGLGWTEATSTFALDPVKFTLGDVGDMAGHLTLAQVPRGVFSPNAQQVMPLAAQIEAGALELTLHDRGAVDLLVAQFALGHQISRDVARSTIIDSIRTAGAQTVADHPDAGAAIEALAHFIETPHQSLVIRLTPRGKVPALQLIQLLKTDPAALLGQFQVEASNGL